MNKTVHQELVGKKGHVLQYENQDYRHGFDPETASHYYIVEDLSGDPNWTRARDSGSLKGWTDGDGTIQSITQH